jgi:hypothetical protein
MPRADSVTPVEAENAASICEKKSMSSLTLSSFDEFPIQRQQVQQEDDGIFEGYTADRSAASMKSSSDNDSTVNEDKLGLVIDVLQSRSPRRDHFKCTTISSRSKQASCRSFKHALLPTMDHKHSGNRLKRKRAKSRRDVHQQKRFANDKLLPLLSKKSPIHPDIDLSLTHHIAVKDDLLSATTDAVLHVAAVSQSIRSHDASPTVKQASFYSHVETASAIPALSKAVLEYFADLRQQVAVNTAEGSRKRSTRTGREDKSSPLLNKGVAAIPSMAQIISDVASFSDEPYRLEDALDLADTPRYVYTEIVGSISLFTENPRFCQRLALFLFLFVLHFRLLLEATSPHRVIHVNAAFSRKIIAAASGSRRCNAQVWIETQNKLHQRSSKNRSLQEALEDIIPENLTVPLTCYPVLGTSSVTHYLIEATPVGSTTGARKAQKRGRLDNPDKQDDLEQRNIDNTKNDNDHVREETLHLHKHFEAVG